MPTASRYCRERWREGRFEACWEKRLVGNPRSQHEILSTLWGGYPKIDVTHKDYEDEKSDIN